MTYFPFVLHAWNWWNCCFTSSLIEQSIRKFLQLNPARKPSVTSRLNPACWSASFTLCLIRIVTFFNVAPSPSRGPLTQNKLNYSYVMLVADWLYFWHWYLNQLNSAYQTWRVSGFSSSSLWYVKEHNYWTCCGEKVTYVGCCFLKKKKKNFLGGDLPRMFRIRSDIHYSKIRKSTFVL